MMGKTRHALAACERALLAAHRWLYYDVDDDEASGSRPDPDTNTSHRRLKMFHSSSVTPIFTFGRSSFGVLITTAARGGSAMCIRLSSSGPLTGRR